MRALYLRGGVLVQAESRLMNETLGMVLVSNGWLTPEHLEEVLSKASGEGRQLGAVLIETGLLSVTAVADALTEQVRLRLFNALRPMDATWCFETGVEAAASFAVSLPLAPLIVEGVSLTYALDRILDELSLEPATPLRRRPGASTEGLGLGGRELGLLQRIANGITLESLTGQANVSYSSLLRVVYAFWALRLVEVLEVSPAPVLATAEAGRHRPEPEGAEARRSHLRKQVLERLGRVSREPTPAPAAARRPAPLDQGGPADQVMSMWLALPRLDYFQLLALPETAAKSDVLIGYGGLLRRLRLEDPPLEWSEPVRQAAAALLDRATEALTVLTDPAQRRAYEASLKGGAPHAQPTPQLLAGVAAQRAERLRSRGRYEEAVEVIQRALEGAAGEPSLHCELGRTFLEWSARGPDRMQEAERALATAAQMDPAQEMPWVLLGRLARLRKDENTARRMYQKALAVNPASEAAGAELRMLGAGRSGFLDKLLRRK